MDAVEYKHIVLGLIFLKYISDAFEERRRELEAEVAEGLIEQSQYFANFVRRPDVPLIIDTRAE